MILSADRGHTAKWQTLLKKFGTRIPYGAVTPDMVAGDDNVLGDRLPRDSRGGKWLP